MSISAFFVERPILSNVVAIITVVLGVVCLLTLPVSAAPGKSVAFLDGLFMSTSAVCVTGLASVDPGFTFSVFGQTILMLLVQVGGLGIMIEPKGDYVSVLAPMEDSPGFRAGIQAGDRIIKINGKAAGKDLQEAVQRLRGEPGTDVSLTIERPSTGEIKDFKLTRATIKVDMVKDINNKKEFPVGEDKLGYVRIVQFGEKTSEELEKGLKKLKSQGMEALIIDLRWNPGGLLDQAVEVCQKFLPSGTQVVSTEGRNPGQNSVRYARGHGDELNGMPIVILVNENSASASEIVAGCLQDLKRAQIMGEKTFGKGSVQSILPWPDGSALKLTTAKYYTPSHKVIHEHGVTPDSLVPMTEEAERDIVLQKLPGGIESLEELEQLRVRSARDAQLERAQDVLKGILLYTERAPTTPAKPAAGAKIAAN